MSYPARAEGLVNSTCHRMHHPRAHIERLYGKGKNGGRRFILLKLTNKTTAIGFNKYLDTTTDWMLQIVNTHEKQKKKYSISKGSNRFANQLDFTLKEKYIKDKARETGKTLRKKQKHND